MKDLKIKICGLKKQEDVDACVHYGAHFVGIVGFEGSVRFVAPSDIPKINDIRSVLVVVKPDLGLIERYFAKHHFDYVQIHGIYDTDFLANIRQKFGCGLILPYPINNKSDVDYAATNAINDIADFLLFDSKTEHYGGSGIAFDWDFLQKIQCNKPFFLSGGINIKNLVQAAKITQFLDLSSGVESSPGIKSLDKIINLLESSGV